MTIREIEALSSMTRANIRFYEAEGLLSPARGENGYRDYSEDDLEILRRIRLFRTLQFSLTEIKALQCGDESVWRIAALVCAFLLLYGAENLVSLEATMPRYRGDLTAEEFYANYNQLASWYGMLSSDYSLGNDGHWWNSADVAVMTEMDGITIYLGSTPAFLDFDLTQKDGVVTGVSFHYEFTDGTLYISSYQDQMVLTVMSFVCAQKGFGIFSSARKRILNVVGTWSGESYTYTCNGITIDYQVEYSGYMMLPYDNILAPGENPSYSMTFTITKDA